MDSPDRRTPEPFIDLASPFSAALGLPAESLTARRLRPPVPFVPRFGGPSRFDNAFRRFPSCQLDQNLSRTPPPLPPRPSIEVRISSLTACIRSLVKSIPRIRIIPQTLESSLVFWATKVTLLARSLSLRHRVRLSPNLFTRISLYRPLSARIGSLAPLIQSTVDRTSTPLTLRLGPPPLPRLTPYVIPGRNSIHFNSLNSPNSTLIWALNLQH